MPTKWKILCSGGRCMWIVVADPRTCSLPLKLGQRETGKLDVVRRGGLIAL